MIIGPVWYNRIEYKGKIIHNFGDVHDKNTPCKEGIKFHEWLDKFIREQDLVDIFFELPPPKKLSPYRFPVEAIPDSYLRDTFNFFLPCITRLGERGEKSIRDKCYPNARFHMIDIRRRLLPNGYELTADEATNELYHLIYSIEKKTEIIELFQRSFAYLDEDEHTFISSQLEELFSTITTDVTDEPPLIIKISRLALLMDLFTIIRICRRYDTTKRTDFNNKSVHTAVLYTGIYHAQSISSLFEKMGATVTSPKFHINRQSSTYLQCIRLGRKTKKRK